MKPQHLLLPLLLCFASPALADETDCKAANALLQQFLSGLRAHRLDQVGSLLAKDMAVRVEWLDSEPVKQFTLSREDYLQQMKATWHFGSAETLEAGPVRWQVENTACIALLTVKENRRILDTPTGQENQLRLRLENLPSEKQGNGWRITAINTRTKTW
ncbi:MAG TPA: hypothetical protein VF050_06035 [Moraxellaceae bacterium]